MNRRFIVILISAMLCVCIPAVFSQQNTQQSDPAKMKAIKATLYNTMLERGIDVIKPQYKQLQQQYANDVKFTPDVLDAVGDSLLNGAKIKEATAIYKFNAELYPNVLTVPQQLKLAALTDDTKLLLQLEQQLEKLPPDSLAPLEIPVNALGYQLLGLNLNKASLIALKLNNDLFPESLNTYDSYGWTLMHDGQKKEALKVFKNALTKKPDFSSGLRAVKMIEGAPSSKVNDPKADDIIQRHVNAIGGEAKLRAISTKKMTGYVETARGNKITDVRYFKRPNWFRTEQFNQVNVSNGEKCWNVTAENWTEFPVGQRMGLIYHSEFDDGFIDYHQKGIFYQFAGVDTLQGKNVNHLRMTYKDGSVHDLYFNLETGLHTMTRWARCNGSYQE